MVKCAIGMDDLLDEEWYTIGIHPEASGPDVDFGRLKALAVKPQCIGIWECGMDYSQKPVPLQIRVFKRQLEIARIMEKPIIIHVQPFEESLLGIWAAYWQIVKEIHQETTPETVTIWHFFLGDSRSTLREESSQTNVILQYKLLAAILSAVCSVIQQLWYVLLSCW